MTHSNINHDSDVTVAVALNIDIEAASALPDYDPGVEYPPTLIRARLRGPYKKRAAVDALLEPLRMDASAGVSDELIARRVGLTKEVVRQWRRRQHIDGRRGRLHPAMSARFALDAMLNRDSGALTHLVAASPVHGRWQPPAYALRRPLQYDAFVEVVVYAAERFTADKLAEALGFEVRDIVDALALHAARST